MSNNNQILSRITFIDALRGLAVLLMVEQHLGFWLWNQPSGPIRFTDFPLIISFNALGGFAAPAFITLAGVGTSLLLLRHSNPDKTLLIRGMILMAYGYILNLITPSWFSPGSWYVLHLIGFAILLSVLIRRLPPPAIIIVSMIVLAATVAFQNALDTPLSLGNERMRRLDMSGGFLRLAVAEGHFPIFPWLFYYLTGMIAGRRITDGKFNQIAVMASVYVFTGFLLSLAYLLNFSFAVSYPLMRAFRIHLGFYPSSPAFALLMTGGVLFSIMLMKFADNHWNFRENNPLVCLGRSSLTILIAHIFLIRELSHHLGFWKIFSTEITLFIILIILCAFSFLSYRWYNIKFRYGAEWLLRRTSG
jgi:hypothetical protein